MRRFELYDTAFPWGKTLDKRRAILISPEFVIDDPRVSNIHLAPVSAAFDLFDECRHFRIRADSPDFEATGLSRESYAAVDMTTLWPKSELEEPRGEIEGDMASALAEFIQHFFRF